MGLDACLLVDVAPLEVGELPVLMAVGAAARLHESVRAEGDRGARRVERPGSVIIPGAGECPHPPGPDAHRALSRTTPRRGS